LDNLNVMIVELTTDGDSERSGSDDMMRALAGPKHCNSKPAILRTTVPKLYGPQLPVEGKEDAK
jgi:hypothetical protein